MRRGGRRLGLSGWGALALVAGLVLPTSLWARPERSAVGRLWRPSPAVQRGLERLVALQDERTGAFGTRFRVASTGLAGLALLASGSDWHSGPHAEAIRGAVRFLLDAARQRPQPGLVFFFDGETQGKMHAHGIALLFLAEVYGQTERDAELRGAIRAAITTTVLAQTSRGGWGYHLRGETGWGEDEASVTITQIQALRAARNAGFQVPARVIDNAVAYVKRSMKPDGSCRYSLSMGGAESQRSSFELTAAAVATLNASGVYRSRELERGLAYLRRTWPKYKSPDRAATDFYFYGNLYAAQALWQAGESDWSAWFPAVQRQLLRRQLPSGGWNAKERNFGEAYATATALLILQIPRRTLPIFER
ncbi:MAG: prenyltransferase [Planctomycetota bacterium]|nr:MAG: prenyltransferase [Planctomycetota bacterium]